MKGLDQRVVPSSAGAVLKGCTCFCLASTLDRTQPLVSSQQIIIEWTTELAWDKLSLILPEDKSGRNVLQKVGNMGPKSYEDWRWKFGRCEHGGNYWRHSVDKLTWAVHVAMVREESWGEALFDKETSKERQKMEPRRGGRRRRKTETPVPVNPKEERFEEGLVDRLKAGQGFAVRELVVV